MQHYIGATDLPADSDDFDIGHYRDSMVRFIENCNTPMTISIQGTWGTGKTSFMKMVEKKLTKCKFIEFNTWQFSQFDMDNTLSLNLIRSLIDDMGLKEAQKKGITGAINGARIGKFFGSVGAVAIEKAFGLGNLGGAAGEVIEKIGRALSDEEESNPLNAVKEIKREFEQCVSECRKANQVDRIVIFIDDLDRLEPGKAVELLEVLKNFLDCADCVFVLAIDYDVVQKGVAAKYGTVSGGVAIDRKKGKDFFDKIIQVPFKMPVAQYNIDNYLEKCLIGITDEGKPIFDQNEDLSEYVQLVKSSIGTNPRAIKRLVNAYQLLVMVVRLHENLDIQKCKLVIFATLCLQELDLNVYNAIVRDRDELSGEKLLSFLNKDADKIQAFFPSLNLDEEDEESVDLDAISGFMEELASIIGKGDPKNLSDTELAAFRDILNFSSVTSADDGNAPARKRERAKVFHDIEKAELRNNTHADLKNLVDVIQKCMGDGAPVTLTVRNRRNETVTELGYGNYRGSIAIYEVRDGFAVELYAKRRFYEEFLTDELKKIMYEKNRPKKLCDSSSVGLQYFRFPAAVGNEDQEADVKAFVTRFREFYELERGE